MERQQKNLKQTLSKWLKAGVMINGVYRTARMVVWKVGYSING